MRDPGGGDLQAHAKDKECAQAVHDLFAARSQPAQHRGRERVAHIDQRTHDDHRHEDGPDIEEMRSQGAFIAVRAQGEQDGDGARAGRHGKGHWIKEDVIHAVRSCGLGFLR